MPNQTGGDFCGGVPKDCWKDTTPGTAEASVASSQKVAGAASVSSPKPARHVGGNTSHLSNARYLDDPSVGPSDVRHGWHPNVTPK